MKKAKLFSFQMVGRGPDFATEQKTNPWKEATCGDRHQHSTSLYVVFSTIPISWAMPSTIYSVYQIVLGGQSKENIASHMCTSSAIATLPHLIHGPTLIVDGFAPHLGMAHRLVSAQAILTFVKLCFVFQCGAAIAQCTFDVFGITLQTMTCSRSLNFHVHKNTLCGIGDLCCI